MADKKKKGTKADKAEEQTPRKITPKLDKETRAALDKRAEIAKKRPNFRRQEWFRYDRLSESWRRPRGLHSKTRTNKKYRSNKVRIGYGGPRAVRGLHPSGFEEKLVYNVDDLEDIDPKTQCARIGHSVGVRKRIAIEARADELKIRVLNRRPE